MIQNEACITYHRTPLRTRIVGLARAVQDITDLVKVEPALPDVLQVVPDEAYYVANPLLLQIQARRLCGLQTKMCMEMLRVISFLIKNGAGHMCMLEYYS